jgi:nucleotidyltransferase substrate binding protein (TIGR01987 family)
MEKRMTAKDIRWIQRFNNYGKAFGKLSEAVKLAEERDLTELEKQGLIQAFEYTHELAWNTLKDFLEGRGTQNIYGSKDASKEAFKAGLIKNGETWKAMIASRNQTSHTYDEATAEEIKDAILHSYFFEFETLQTTLRKLKEEEQS